ncbi:MAG: hypothetical protein K6G07_02415 [Lachnospiraceae bacterium]|nr:hypothetical protein [Lachnospiraceae bacterium]
MNNTQLYPFERNRYYPKKRLSSADYVAEQDYFNNKRRFLNGLMYGSGIVCGLGVFSLDDLSLLVESGVALDGMGREIVVESSDVKKLSALEGFDSLKSNQATLCLRYKEEPVHKVYAIDQSDPEKEFQYNRVKEGYELFLMDTDEVPEVFSMDSEFLTRGVLMTSDHYNVEFMMPATVSRDKLVKAVLSVTKLSDEETRLTYHGVLQVPAFVSENGTNEIAIDIENLELSDGDTVTYDYWMKALDTSAVESNIILKTGSAAGYENDKAIPVPANFTIKVLLSDRSPRELVNREIGRLNLEMKNIGGQGDFICLANLKLVRTDSAYIIEEVDESSVKHYVTAPVQEMQRSAYLEYFVREAGLTNGASNMPAYISDPAGRTSDSYGNAPEIATGVLEIPIGENARKGDVYYSGEIMHGLGKGNVYVEVGYEYLREDETVGANAKNTIYGNPEIFAEAQRTVVDAETAIRVLNDKGSFIVGARLLRNIDYLVLNYRWVAIKFPSGDDLGLKEDFTGKSISPETPTVRMGTRENHYFGVRYNNMDPVSVTYELTESGSGEITSDGIYTAPSKPGVYEIRIYCTDMPVLCTYAYAIVEKKGYEQLENPTEEMDVKNPFSGMIK